MAIFLTRDSVSFSASQVTERAVWNSPTPLLSAGPPNNDSIQFDVASLNEATANLLARPRPAVAAAINRRLAPVALAAFEAWPVFSGTSKAGLFYRVEIGPSNESITVHMGGSAVHTNDIKDGQTAKILLIDPALEGADLMAVDVSLGIADG